VKRIQLTKKQVTHVNESDYQSLNQCVWRARWDKKLKSYYAVRTIPHPSKKGKRIEELMHRRIMKLKFGDRREIDHVDHDTLNNTKENLRIVSHIQNSENRKDQSKYGAGITFDHRCRANPYQLRIYVNGKQRSIGYYPTPEKAQEARKKFLERMD